MNLQSFQTGGASSGSWQTVTGPGKAQNGVLPPILGRRRATNPEGSGEPSGERGVQAIPGASAPPASVTEMLASGWPNMNPYLREEQLDWARKQLYSEMPLTPYRTLVCCRAVLFLSRDVSERAAVRRIQDDVEIALGAPSKPKTSRISIWAALSVFGLIVAALLVLQRVLSL